MCTGGLLPVQQTLFIDTEKKQPCGWRPASVYYIESSTSLRLILFQLRLYSAIEAFTTTWPAAFVHLSCGCVFRSFIAFLMLRKYIQKKSRKSLFFFGTFIYIASLYYKLKYERPKPDLHA